MARTAWSRAVVIGALGACIGARPPHRPPASAPASTPASTPASAPAGPQELAIAPPAAVVHTTCIPPRFGGGLAWFTATDTTATACLHHGSPGDPDEETRCIDVDLATGAYASAPPRAAPTDPPPGPVRIIDDARGVRLCRGRACTKLALRPIPAWPDGPHMTYEVDVSADGTRALARWPGDAEVILLDARTGKRLRTLSVAPCTSEFGFLDDTVWIQGSKCNWIDEWSYLLDRDGHPRAVLDQIHAMWARPTRLDGDVWAILGTAGDGYVAFEASTGVVRGVQRSTPHYDDIGCHDCSPATAKGVGEVPAFTRTPAGRTLLFTAGVAVLTPDLGAIERHWPLPVCAASAAQPGPTP